jgi:hypothetical protein
MLVERTIDHVSWGTLDLSWTSLDRDWYGQQVAVPADFALAMDPAKLWFVAKREQPPNVLLGATPHEFTPELWRCDVAELFIRDNSSDSYLELNLAPNGAWWSAEFDQARQRSSADEIPIQGVETYAEVSASGGWQVAASIPLAYLESALGFGAHSALNVAFIVDSPHSSFMSKAKLPGSQPDFHQPDYFEQIELRGKT